MNYIFLVIICAGIATMIPRLLPFIFGDKIKIPDWVSDFLSFIPFTAVAALTFPSIFTATDSLLASIVGGTVAALMTYKRYSMVVVLLSAVISTIAVLWLFG